MKRNIYIYWLFLRFSIIEILTYRMNFFYSVFSHLMWAGFTFLTMFLLTSRTKNVFGWSREELFLLTAVFNIMIGVFRALFTKNIDRLARIIHRGELDQYLLKPVDTQFWVSMRYFNLGAFLRVPVACAITWYILSILKVSLTGINIVIFFFLLFCGILTLYSIWFLIMTLLLWFSNLVNLEEFLNTINSVARFPREVFENASVFLLLTFLPLTLIVSVPTKYLLGRVTFFETIVLLFFSILLFVFSKKFWKFALHFYTSASG